MTSVHQIRKDLYFNWPVTFSEGWAWCAASGSPPCPACPGDSTRGITKSYGLTPRLLCAAIKAHAESSRSPE